MQIRRGLDEVLHRGGRLRRAAFDQGAQRDGAVVADEDLSEVLMHAVDAGFARRLAEVEGVLPGVALVAVRVAALHEYAGLQLLAERGCVVPVVSRASRATQPPSPSAFTSEPNRRASKPFGCCILSVTMPADRFIGVLLHHVQGRGVMLSRTPERTEGGARAPRAGVGRVKARYCCRFSFCRDCPSGPPLFAAP
jgi:hypothetical protein